jgi:hypothetical protein
MARNTNASIPVTVTINGYTGLRYGFLSRIREALMDNLGQTKIYSTISDMTGIVFGANSPKPPRASKLFATGYESSFCSSDKIASLKADGWQIKRAKKARMPITTDRSKAYYVTINGIKRAWNSANSATMPTSLITATGIKEATKTETGLIWGASFPFPSKARTVLADGSTYSTFVDPSKEDSLPADWILDQSKSNYTLQQLREILPAPE